jgi:hypothetical protein
LPSEVGSPKRFATTPWSYSSPRLPVLYGEAGYAYLHGAGHLALDQEWASELGSWGRDVDDMFKETAFGAAWSVIEDRSPLFARRSLRPAELPEQITIALSFLRKGGSSGDNNPGTQGFQRCSLAQTGPLD